MLKWFTSRDRAELVDMLRMWPTLVVALITLGVIHVIAPQQSGIIVYKICSISLAAYLGYWVDRWCFAESRVGDMFDRIDASGTSNEYHGRMLRLIRFAVAELRRAAIIIGAMIASAMMF